MVPPTISRATRRGPFSRMRAPIRTGPTTATSTGPSAAGPPAAWEAPPRSGSPGIPVPPTREAMGLRARFTSTATRSTRSRLRATTLPASSALFSWNSKTATSSTRFSPRRVSPAAATGATGRPTGCGSMTVFPSAPCNPMAPYSSRITPPIRMAMASPTFGRTASLGAISPSSRADRTSTTTG